MEFNKETNIFSLLDGLALNRFHASTVIVAGLILAAAGFNLQILSYAMPVIAKEWGLSPVEAGGMVTWGFAGLMAGAIGFGTFSDRFGHKKALMAVISVFSVAGVAASFAPHHGSLCVLCFLAGIGIGGAFPLTVALLAEFPPSKTRESGCWRPLSHLSHGPVRPQTGSRPDLSLGRPLRYPPRFGSNRPSFPSCRSCGVFVVGTPTALNVVCSEIYPTGVRSMGVASTQAAGRMGSILGPMVGGLLQAFGFSFHQFFFLFAIPCFACIFLVASYPINLRGEALEAVSRRLGCYSC